MNENKGKNSFCPFCMERHEVILSNTEELIVFKGIEVNYSSVSSYCSNTDDYFETEEQMSANDISMKNAYRKKCGLMTSEDIIALRHKYAVSQSDLALLLGWGEKTITRYEGHQVQNAAHDSILRKIDSDPEWFIELLDAYEKKDSLSSFDKCRAAAVEAYETQRDYYLQKSIKGSYARYNHKNDLNGNALLNIPKVVDAIRYFSNSQNVNCLFKVKLMKMLWYSDALAFKNNNKAITGLVYKALPMGAVPIAYDLIIDLRGVKHIDIDFGEGTACQFVSDGVNSYPSLTESDIAVLDSVIEKFGNLTKKNIVEAMHCEKAYSETAPRDIICFTHAKYLSI